MQVFIRRRLSFQGKGIVTLAKKALEITIHKFDNCIAIDLKSASTQITSLSKLRRCLSEIFSMM